MVMITGCTSSNLPYRAAPITVGIGKYTNTNKISETLGNEYFLCELNGTDDYACNAVTKKTRYKLKAKPNVDIDKLLKNEPYAVVHFDFNKSNLNNLALTILNDLNISKLQGKKIFIRGYTDNIGGQLYNENLAMKRAKSVDIKLRSMGLLDGKLIPLAYGLCCYVESNDTAYGREKNRRVEIYVH